jgi:hypothetical protein
VADFNQFGSAKPPQSANAQHCAQCEAMLADVLDGTLSPADQATFDLHVAGCSDCTAMLADARRGASWLEMLKPHRPEPSAALIERILTQTSGITNQANQRIVLGSTDHLRNPETLLGVPALTPALNPAAAARVIPFRQRFVNAFRLESIRQTLMQPRLAMTAAMAFFSIALTLNLTGVRLSQLRASDLKPSSIKRAFYETNARVVRTFDNMRVVYELESRVRDLQRATDSEAPAPAPSNQNDSAPSPQPSGDKQSPSQKPQNDPDHPDQKQATPRPKSGTSRRESPEGRLQFVGSISGRGIPPAAMQAFVTFTPNVHKHQQEGGLV